MTGIDRKYLKSFVERIRNAVESQTEAVILNAGQKEVLEAYNRSFILPYLTQLEDEISEMD